MEKKVYYQAQFSEDGENWKAFNAHTQYNVRESLDEIKEIYKHMIEFHTTGPYPECKYHRIVKFTVENEVIA